MATESCQGGLQMSDNEREAIIASIRKRQENIAVAIGVTIAMTLSTFFFTYALLVDRGLSGALWMMAIATVVMLGILIKLKSVAFFVVRLWLGWQPRYKAVLATMTATAP